MNIEELILKELDKKKEITSVEIIKKTGFTRSYINRFFRELEDEGRILLIGKTHNSKYILADKKKLKEIKANILKYRKKIRNDLVEKPEEYRILETIQKETGIFFDIKENVKDILSYSFTEMLNNAIEHSQTDIIDVIMERKNGKISFDVIDYGIGIFNNIMKKFSLTNELEAIQELLKGKLTSLPAGHTGEGIFFTSKAADNLIIQSSNKKLIFNNIIDDIFIKNGKQTIGTRIKFLIDEDTQSDLKEIFNIYSDEGYDFSKTSVLVKLYTMGDEYISRSQARRIVTGLNKFKVVTIDFRDIETVGQAFADEIFRVWQSGNPQIKINTVNENGNVKFMINRAISSK